MGQPPVNGVQGVADPEPEGGGDLIVPATAGVQLPPDIPQAFNQRLFDVHVNVFQFGPKLELRPRLALQIGLDLVAGSPRAPFESDPPPRRSINPTACSISA
jgi:hypothetical protein